MNKIAVLLLLFIFSACNFGGKSPSMLAMETTLKS